MLSSMIDLLIRAQDGGYAVGAFNIYNLEGARAVIEAAEELRSPVIVQMLPSALQLGGLGLISMCLAMAEEARVEVAVHLDHCSSEETLAYALDGGIGSVMADGSSLSYEDNLRFTRAIVTRASALDRGVEAELGRLSGEEDGVSVEARMEQLTSPEQASDFVARTGVHALAVCIGNVHGRYHLPPDLDFDLLAALAARVRVPLVLHGTSGLPESMIERAMDHGVCKFNVNTEVRSAGLAALATRLQTAPDTELVELMRAAVLAMKHPVAEKIALFRSAGKAE